MVQSRFFCIFHFYSIVTDKKVICISTHKISVPRNNTQRAHLEVSLDSEFIRTGGNEVKRSLLVCFYCCTVQPDEKPKRRPVAPC